MSFFDFFKHLKTASFEVTANSFSYDPGNLEALYKHVANISEFPVVTNYQELSEFVEKIGMKAFGVLLANAVLGMTLSLEENEVASRRCFVYTLRCELDGLYIATGGGIPGSVGLADAIVKQTINSLYSLYRAEGALTENCGYNETPHAFINAVQMKLYQSPDWRRYHHQVKLRCYTMQFMNVAYYQVFAQTPEEAQVDMHLFVKTFNVVRSEAFNNFLNSVLQLKE